MFFEERQEQLFLIQEELFSFSDGIGDRHFAPFGKVAADDVLGNEPKPYRRRCVSALHRLADSLQDNIACH